MADQQPDPYFDLIVDEDLTNNEWPKGLDEIKAKGTQCIAINAITKENFEALKHIKTQSAGWTLARAINTGVVNPTSFLDVTREILSRTKCSGSLSLIK
ncbi:hypothetical protein QZH41_000940 [Actinostola sp. cb2023]|nr:hypothetical protein QZH41_000940 [Actinostola sp. cb2023]